MSLEPARQAEECGVRVKEEGDATDRQQEHSVEIKAEWEEEIDGWQQNSVLKKEDWSADDLGWSLKSYVKEESGLLELYAGHKVEGDLVLGPEGPQLPDSAFAQPPSASSPLPSRIERSVSPGRATERDGQGSGAQKPGQEKPYSCDVCMKQFKGKYSLVGHMRTHTGEKPFSCNMCVKSFTRKMNLNIHRRTHTGERPFSCNMCVKRFSQKISLDIHRRTHTEGKPYSCDVCMKRFTQKAYLNEHKRKCCSR